MSEFLHKLFSSDFMGHGYCYLWKPEIVWLHAISDGLIAIAYYFIPVTLVYLVRKRRDLPFHWVFFMFGVFILGCGATHAMEIRFVEGRFREPGAATAWFRLRAPLIHGEPTRPLDRVAAAGDFGNGIASVLDWGAHVFINPDLTLYLEREPVDEWVALQSEMRVLSGSAAVAESVLWDRRGRIGRALQSLVVGPRAPAT